MTTTEATQSTIALGSLADPRAARPGRCGIAGCTEAGAHWYRTTTTAGVRAVRSCAAHEAVAENLLQNLSLDDAVRLATPAQRRHAQARIDAAHTRATAAARASADLAGASSLTHTAALASAWYRSVAECEEAFLEALLARASE